MPMMTQKMARDWLVSIFFAGAQFEHFSLSPNGLN
jgi:hypothetical protein